MAKGNVLLGQMRGKVGDVLFKHVGGQQITSAVNHPSNPKTERQQYQRAIMATVTRAYVAGSRIFDHSFQGLQTGAQNQAKFFRENCKILRNLMVDEVNAPSDPNYGHLGARARCVLPGSLSPVGFDGMLISDGTYDQGLFKIEQANPYPGISNQLIFRLPVGGEEETFAEYSKRCGIFADDYYTIVGFFNFDAEQDTPIPVDVFEKTVYTGNFFYIRMHTKESFVHGIGYAADALYEDLFEIDEFRDDSGQISMQGFLESFISQPLAPYDILKDTLEFDLYGAMWMGIIRSHKNKKLRSRSYLYRGWWYERSGLTPNRVKEFWYDTPVTSINNPE